MEVKKQVALCAIGRRENLYAREFVEYYLDLGFSHLYLYDNARTGEEQLRDVLADFERGGLVTILPWLVETEDCQREAYNHCYHTYGPQYEWMAFFDFDEYLTIANNSRIGEFMQQFTAYQCLLVNWMNYTDSGLLEYDPRPLTERFTIPMPLDKQVGGDYPENNHVKCIVRTDISALKFRNPHVPKEPKLKCCNAKGEKCRQQPRIPYNHEVAYLRHYTTKTIGEWLQNKMLRGVPDRSEKEFRNTYAEFFFKINERTAEKEAVISRWYQRKGRVAAVALGRMGNQMFIAAAAMTFARRTGREFIGLVYNHGKNFDYDYPAEQFTSVMRNVKYIEPESVADFYHMKQGEYLSNGFPDITEPDVVLCDYYQDATCIDRDIALQMFAPYDSIKREIRELYGDLTDCVCVNVRRGDYLKVQHVGFRVLTKQEIEDMLTEHFWSCDSKIRVLFVSDDPEWCRKNFTGEQYLFADKPCRWKPEMDLYLMTQCGAGCIISNSTFSWWGAYLNEQSIKVVYPWPWFTDQKHPKMTNLLPAGWTKYGQTYTLWVTYHKDSLIKEYNLKEDEHHRLFAAHHDARNLFMSEFVTLHYVWNHRVRSTYVGFCHYRRMLQVQRLPKQGECQVLKKIRFPHGETMYEQYARCHNIKDMDLMLQIIDKRLGADNPYSSYLRTSLTMLPNVCFLMAWRDYMKMGDFLFPLLDDFAGAVGCGMVAQNWQQKAVADFGEADAPYQRRLLGFLAERLVSAWIHINLKWYI